MLSEAPQIESKQLGCSFAKLLPSASNVLLGHPTFAVVVYVVYNYKKWKIDATRALDVKPAFFGNNLGLMVIGTVSLRSASCCFGFTIICITTAVRSGECHEKPAKAAKWVTRRCSRVLKLPEVRLLFVVAPKQHRAIKIERRSSLSHSVHDLRHFLFLSRDVHENVYLLCLDSFYFC